MGAHSMFLERKRHIWSYVKKKKKKKKKKKLLSNVLHGHIKWHHKVSQNYSVNAKSGVVLLVVYP